MMTRKDYIKIAEIINNLTSSGHWKTIVAKELEDALADYMESDNPAFDRQRFIDACYGGK